MQADGNSEAWMLDCEQGVLMAPTGPVALRPKSFDVLRFLAENAGRIVSRDELLKTIWRDVIVTEESLTQCISEIRHALGDTAQHVVKTVPKRGYIFASSVARQGKDRLVLLTDESGNRPSSGRPSLLGRAFDGPSVAVLPFANLSGDPAQEYLSDGITDDVITSLSQFRELAVIARNSSYRYKDTSLDLREIGKELDVLYVVQGTVRRLGDRIRISAQLVEIASAVHRWAKRYDNTLGEVFAVEDEITHSIVPLVVAHIAHAEVERTSRKPASSWTAYDLAMQGDQAMHAYQQSWGIKELYRARRLFEQALKVDPNNARVRANLSYTYLHAYMARLDEDYGKSSTLERGYELASTAVAIDPNLPLARAHLGWALHWKRDPDAAIREFERAFQLNPNFSDGRFPAVLIYAGEAARALDEVQAHLRLDPFHQPQVHAFQGHALYMLRRYAEAVVPLRECIQRAPHILFGHLWLVATFVRLGLDAEGKQAAAELLKHAPDFTIGGWHALSYYRRGQDAEHMVSALREAGLP